MSTQKETIQFILDTFDDKRFTARAMFGEYALYANGKVVSLICDDLMHVKIVPASAALERICEKGAPYPGAKQHYIVEESQIATMEGLADILLSVARSLPAKKQATKKAASKKRG
jgi:DNA transformation protein and related proteins